MKPENMYEVGSYVRMQGDHPCAGQEGRIIRRVLIETITPDYLVHVQYNSSVYGAMHDQLKPIGDKMSTQGITDNGSNEQTMKDPGPAVKLNLKPFSTQDLLDELGRRLTEMWNSFVNIPIMPNEYAIVIPPIELGDRVRIYKDSTSTEIEFEGTCISVDSVGFHLAHTSRSGFYSDDRYHYNFFRELKPVEIIYHGCLRAPEGWFCTRGRSHTGPCAAHSIAQN